MRNRHHPPLVNIEPQKAVSAALEHYQTKGKNCSPYSGQHPQRHLHVPLPLGARHGQDSQLAHSGLPGEQGKRFGWSDRAVVSAATLLLPNAKSPSEVL